MRVALVTTWNKACGIAEHSRYLKMAMDQTADIDIVVVEDLHPRALLPGTTVFPPFDVVILNYHAALHSQWSAEAIRDMQSVCPVLVIYHDTGIPNTEQAKSICAAASAVVVHEPDMEQDLVCDSGIHYWRMGVPDWTGWVQFEYGPNSWNEGRPILGSIGFPFGWKCYDDLARVTKDNGWALFLIAAGATQEQIDHWCALNPCTQVMKHFVGSYSAIGWLAGCDATAFTYVCHNAGQSAAILMGIAARKPVIAFHNCRQFRALWADELASHTIRWCESFAQVGWQLRHVPLQRCDPGIVALQEQESWRHLGPKFVGLLKEMVG